MTKCQGHPSHRKRGKKCAFWICHECLAHSTKTAQYCRICEIYDIKEDFQTRSDWAFRIIDESEEHINDNNNGNRENSNDSNNNIWQ